MRVGPSRPPAPWRVTRTDRGNVVVLFAMAVTVLMLITAMVIDLSFLRDDRRADQKVADAAATAAAVSLAKRVDGQAACQSAVASIIENISEISSISGLDCTQIPASCDSTAPPATSQSASGTSGPYTVTVVHPVVNTDPLMTTGSAIGGPSRAITGGDGNPCARIGVKVELERAPTFGAIASPAKRTTSVHTVALASTTPTPDLPINLLILERYDCNAIEVDGGGTLVISPITVDGEEHAGVLAVESDGTKDLCDPATDGYIGTLSVRSAKVRADGPPGCANEIPDDPAFPPTPTIGEGCGDITLYAPGVPGPASSAGKCESNHYWPACTSTGSSGSIQPHPERMGSRYTRGAVDHIFNCKSSYASESWYDASLYHVDPCFDATADPTLDLDYVDEVRDFAETPAGFTEYTGPCIVESDVVVPEGNVHVKCPGGLFVKRALTFMGGNVIFDGDVVVEASAGHLTLNACGKDGVAVDGTRIPGNCDPTEPLITDESKPGFWKHGFDYDERQYSSDAAWAVFRNGGGIRKAGGAAVTIHDTVVFLGENATVDSATTHALQLAGNDNGGALQWSATREGPFEDLALWSDSEIEHAFAGNAALELEGVFFAPMGYITYAGGSLQKQLAAQFITERLRVTGSGLLDIAPNIERSIPESQARSTLIR